MILFVLYLISLVWMVVFLAFFIKPFKQKKKFKDNKIKYIPLKKPDNPGKNYYVLNSGELVEVTK